MSIVMMCRCFETPKLSLIIPGGAKAKEPAGLLIYLLVDILARVPVNDPLKTTMLVYRCWYRIIRSDDFVNTQVHHSPYGLLFYHRFYWKFCPIFDTTTQGRIETCYFRSNCTSRFFASAHNGLVLESHPENSILNITNVVTRKRMALPRYPRGPHIHADNCGIAYVVVSMDYKMALPFTNGNFASNVGLGILTVGVDKLWRNVEV